MFADAEAYKLDPLLDQVLPPALRQPRERMEDLVAGYYSTKQRNDGTIFTQFDDACLRRDNGLDVTDGVGNAAVVAPAKLPAAEVKRRAFTRIMVFGARVTMETKLFGALDDQAEVIVPALPDLDLISETYKRIVEKGSATPEELESLRTLAHRLIEKERLDGILLAGTDWSFVFDADNADFPHVDGARAHIQAIMSELAGAD